MAISVRRRRSGLGMDAITLQEKLVERLLCPRGRTARQKVKEGSCLEMDGGTDGWMDGGGGASGRRDTGSEVTAGGFHCVMLSPPAVPCFVLWLNEGFRTWVLTAGDPRKSL